MNPISEDILLSSVQFRGGNCLYLNFQRLLDLRVLEIPGLGNVAVSYDSNFVGSSPVIVGPTYKRGDVFVN